MFWYYLSIIVFSYLTGKVIYHLYFHPLARFPGPKLAAATSLYDFCWSVVRDGQFIWEIERMHAKYGPIVRINPEELHICDPKFYGEIYAGGNRKVDGYLPFTRSTGISYSMFAATDQNHHQFRRNLLSNAFSKKSIIGSQPIIQDKIEKVIAKLSAAIEDGSVVNLNTLASAFTADTVSHYSYGVSLGCLDGQSVNILAEATQAVMSFSHILRFLPISFSNAKKIHPNLVSRFSENAATVLRTHRTISSLAAEVLKDPEASKDSMFKALANPSVPAEERHIGRLEDEGFTVLGAGTETTAHSLALTFYHLLDNPLVFTQLFDELKTVTPDVSSKPSVTALENLPFLRAVVNEGLRLSLGTLSRHPRIAPDRALQYNEWTIPPGTPCSTASYFVQMNETIFPNAKTFDPYRWLRAAEQNVHLESQLVLFSKGSRSCLGINMAHAEMFMLVAAVVRRVKMRLYGTTINCVTPWKDHVVVIPKDRSGVKVIVESVDEC